LFGIKLTANPEPASLTFACFGMMVVGGVVMRRRIKKNAAPSKETSA
jgi:hypothetical protein